MLTPAIIPVAGKTRRPPREASAGIKPGQFLGLIVLLPRKMDSGENPSRHDDVLDLQRRLTLLSECGQDLQGYRCSKC